MHSTTLKKLLSMLTVFTMVFSMIAMVQPMQAKAATAEIAISNGDFETGAFGGAVNGSNGASIVEKATYEGNYALKFDATGEILTVTGYLAEATTAESTVTLSFWAKVLAGSTQNSVNFGLFATNESWGNRVQKYGAGYPIVGGDWKQISQALAVPAGTKIIQAQIYLGAAGATAIVDNISITDGNGNEILQSGGFEKGALNGDFNANDALEIVCTPVHGGNYAAHADKTSGNGNISTTVSIEPSSEARTMTFSYWMYAPTSANGAHNMVVCFDTSSGGWTNLSTKYGAQYATPGVWEQKTMEIAVAANTNTLQIQLYAQDNGADFYIDDLKLTEEVEDVAVNHDATLSLNQVTGDGTWQFSISEAPANKYYKVPATIDGVACNFLMGESGGIMCVYPNFFTALGGAVPTQQIIIEEGAVLKAVDPNGGWAEIDGADTYTLTEKIDLSYVDGAWSKTVYTSDVAVSFNQVTGDGTWQFSFDPAADNKYYKVPAIIDGAACNILMGESGGIMCVYPDFFRALGGAVPTESFVIEEGAVLKAVDANNGWSEIEGADALVVADGLSVVNNLGSWLDMSAYADVTFAELKASDLNVYRAEDQAVEQYRSVFAISSAVAIGNDGWGNFTEVASKVLVDGVETDVVFGQVPAVDESSWANESAFLLYITGEGYWDAATTASSVTICAGTMIVSNLDATKGFKFTEDFVMYKNDDGSWDITEDPTVETAEVAISLQTVTGDGTWQLIPSAALAESYYKIPATVDGVEGNVLAQYNGEILIIYPNFFPVYGGAVPAESFVIAENAVMKAADSENGWAEIADALPVEVTAELKIENIAGKWCEMSKYANVNFTEVYAADLELYYQNIMRLGDYSDAEINGALLMYPEYKDLLEYYGRDANITTFGIKSTVPTVQIPNDANWANFTVLGTVSVEGAEPWETYVMMTPDSSDDAETAMTSGFLVRFYNDFVGDNAVSITIEPGTRIVAKDGVTGFVFVDGYTITRDSNGTWGDAKVQSWNISLGDNIAVNFVMNVEEGDTVSFTVGGQAVTAVADGNEYTINLAAAQMTDEIVISVNGNALPETYSVREYADVILAGNYDNATKNLVKAMLCYGGAAQNYFNYNASNLASNGIEYTAVEPTGSTEVAVTDNLANISFYGATLVYENKTAVRFYFTGSIQGLTCAQGAFVQNGDMYYIEVADINPQDLGKQIEIVVSDGANNLTVAYSALTYMVRMYEKEESSTQTKALVQALYGYYVAAAEYVV